MRYFVCVLVLVLAACGGSGGGGDVTQDGAPTVNGVPVVDLTQTDYTTDQQTQVIQPNATDPDGNPLQYSVSVRSGSAADVVALTGPAGDGSLTLSFPRNGAYNLTLEVSDGSGGVVTKDFTVDVGVSADFTFSGNVKDDDSAVNGLNCLLLWQPTGASQVLSVATSSGDFSFDGLIGAKTDFSVIVPGS
ncbi:MAG: hypothetical protein PF961_02740 [Planctomycetota bacterium]|jgi:hypothetical protein|nr:hypothetical protein [Planctomycetota bacterium]